MNFISSVILDLPTLAKKNNIPPKDKSRSFYLFLDQIRYINTHDQNNPSEMVSCRAAETIGGVGGTTMVTRHPPRKNE